MNVEPTLYLTKEYDEENPVDQEKLKEVYCVAYKVEVNKPGVKDKEVYTFTTIFEQAFKRFKLLPVGRAVLMRYYTDDENLYQLAVDGTSKQWKEEDITPEIDEKLKTIKFSDIYGDIKPNEKLSGERKIIPVTYTVNKPEEVVNNTNTVVNSVPAESSLEENKNIEV